jgi:uncharacterized membrane protein YfcA
MNALAVLGAVGIGLVLGLTGSGGSILTLPVLVYLAGIEPREAVGLSLFIVGMAALAGAWQRARVGEVYFKAVVMFSVSGMLGATLGAKLTHFVSPDSLMLAFAGVMIALGLRMMLMRKPLVQPEIECRPGLGGAHGVWGGGWGIFVAACTGEICPRADPCGHRNLTGHHCRQLGSRIFWSFGQRAHAVDVGGGFLFDCRGWGFAWRENCRAFAGIGFAAGFFAAGFSNSGICDLDDLALRQSLTCPRISAGYPRNCAA